jgi:hypothetical protein
VEKKDDKPEPEVAPAHVITWPDLPPEVLKELHEKGEYAFAPSLVGVVTKDGGLTYASQLLPSNVTDGIRNFDLNSLPTMPNSVDLGVVAIPHRRASDVAVEDWVPMNQYDIERQLQQLIKKARQAGFEISVDKQAKPGVIARNRHEWDALKTDDFIFKPRVTPAKY